MNDEFDECWPRLSRVLQTHYAASFALCPHENEEDIFETPWVKLLGNNDNVRLRNEDSVCFVRANPQKSTQEEKVEEAANEEPELKKRKVRASKQQSIGDILGDMGC